MQFTGWTSEECPQLLVRMCWCCWGWCSTAACCWPAQDLMGHVSALWFYIRHRGPATCGSVSLPRKMGHSVATCKYQDSSSVLPGHAVRGDIVAVGSKLNTSQKVPIFPIIDCQIILSSSFFHFIRILISHCPWSREIKRMSTHAVLQQSAFLVWMLIAMMIPPLWRWRVREDWWWLHHWPTIIIALAGHLVASHNTTGWPEIIITLLASIRPMGSGQVTWSLRSWGIE